MKKKLLDLILYLILGAVATFFLFKVIPNPVTKMASAHPVSIDRPDAQFYVLYFHKNGCPHCELANPVIKKIQRKYPEVGWVVFNVSIPDPKLLKSYASWLGAAKLQEPVTPLIVIGPRSEKPWMSAGFLDEGEDRAPIENEIRRRLELGPIDFESESIRLPVSGFTVMSEVSALWKTLIFGALSGVFPSIFFFLIWLSILTPFSLSKRLILLATGFIVSLGFRYFFHEQPLGFVPGLSIRMVTGTIFFCFTVYVLFQYIQSKRWVLIERHLNGKGILGLFVLCLFFDLIQTSWLGEMQGRLESDLSFMFLGAYILPCLFMTGLLSLIHFMKKGGHSRYILIVFSMMLLTLLWSLVLLSGHSFSGYGSWLIK